MNQAYYNRKEIWRATTIPISPYNAHVLKMLQIPILQLPLKW